jgi:hypothetical protein
VEVIDVSQGTCSIQDCGIGVSARGWCGKHYDRWRHHGTTDPLPRPTVAQRFWSKVDKNGPVPVFAPELGPCWLWTGSSDKHGYGQIRIAGKATKAHRWSWSDTHGPIAEGLDIDHLCRNPPCVRPTHLEPVTHRVNMLRGINPSAANAVATHCLAGHPFDATNTYITPTGARRCRRCHADRSLRYYREAAAATLNRAAIGLGSP